MAAVAKTSWADDVDELERSQTGVNEDYVDENGVRTTIEYKINEDGKKVKITRRTRRVLQPTIVQHAVASRLQLPKFGREKGNKPGPDRATTTVAEDVSLIIRPGGKPSESDVNEKPPPDGGITIKPGATGKVVCRLCRGPHFTAKCPYKDTLAGLEGATGADTPIDDVPPSTADVAPSSSQTTTGGKYVPPSMRAGATADTRSGMRERGAELPTLRVTNISEDTQEQDLRDLFSSFGRVARVYVGRDRETGAGKGFAFVSFEDRAAAQKAIDKVHGKGYDNLILSVQWSQPRTDGPPR